MNMFDTSVAGTQPPSALSGYLSEHDMGTLVKEEHTHSLGEDANEPHGSARSMTPTSPDFEELSADESDSDLDLQSRFEELPTEMIQEIAVALATDIDLSNLSLTSSTFANALNPDDADIWRKRFLAKYDYPIGLEGPEDYAVAYKLRRFVLRRLDGEALRNGDNDKSQHQLLVIFDMILETYASSIPYLPHPTTSKNLAAMSSPSTSRWIVEFLGCALFDNQSAKYGRPNKLFDTLQVTLSHLILHQRSPVLLHLTSSRENYDLGRVYNYNRPFTTILEERLDHLPQKSTSLRCQGLVSKRLKRFNVNMHTLLHIRNFWQRHFSEHCHSAPPQGIGENTYTSMARNLVALGKHPRKWDVPLDKPIPAQMKWIGHYSCLHPWPKSRQSLEEQQSCAEDWDKIDPMTLEFEASSRNENKAFWPHLFSAIPIFESLLPEEPRRRDLHLTYIRGISSFLDVHTRKATANGLEESEKETPKWHPFLADRVHGFIHDIDPQDVLGRKLRRDKFSSPGNSRREQVVPGWKHIVMVIWKPPKRHLLSTLEHAQEDYGGSTGTATAAFNTADIWNDNITAAATNTPTSSAQAQTANANPAQNGNPVISDTSDDSGNLTDEDVNTEYDRAIHGRIEQYSKEYTALLAEGAKSAQPQAPLDSHTTYKPKAKEVLLPLFSMKHIVAMDEDFSSVRHKDWLDVDYAYAYEGIIIPGGKIMMGRWWRIGANGMGCGKEIGPDNVGVEVRPVVTATPSSSNDAVSEGSREPKSSKRKKRSQSTRKSKRTRNQRSAKSSRKSSLRVSTSGEDEWDHDDSNGTGSENEVNDEKEPDEAEKGVEYEFVTMLNGQESRAVNATKGLERGPFVFWVDEGPACPGLRPKV